MNTPIFWSKSIFGCKFITKVQIKTGSHKPIQISNIFEPTAFDNQASISHFLEALIDNKASGIEVIPANKTKEITNILTFNFSQIRCQAIIETSTHI